MSETDERRCDRCEHWTDDGIEQPWDAKEVGFRRCTAIKERWRIQDAAGDEMLTYSGDERTSEKWIAVRRDALKTSRAYVEDGSEYYAALRTSPDFYCALFAPILTPDSP